MLQGIAAALSEAFRGQSFEVYLSALQASHQPIAPSRREALRDYEQLLRAYGEMPPF